jgi:hypothetical protein
MRRTLTPPDPLETIGETMDKAPERPFWERLTYNHRSDEICALIRLHLGVDPTPDLVQAIDGVIEEAERSADYY